MLSILTSRLELMAATPSIARAELLGTDWYQALDAERPAAWPPPLNDSSSLSWFADRIARDPEAQGWFTWYVALRERRHGRRVLAGNCGFKGPPDARGSVEVGYSLLPAWQRQGLGTELVAGLAGWAFGHAAVQRIMAETYPELVGSVRVLEKNGFAPAGRGSLPASIAFELRRSVHELRNRSPQPPRTDERPAR